MRWCCETLKGWFDEAGNRGLAVVVERSTDGSGVFLLQYRSVEMDDAGPRDHPRPLTLAGETGIRFCPWCGVELPVFYSKELDAMERPGFRLRP